MNDTLKGYLKMSYSLFTIILIIFSVTQFFIHRTDYKDDSFQCASYYGDSFVNSLNVHLLYWKENNICCHYQLIDDKIGVLCE